MAETRHTEQNISLLATSMVCPEWPDLECTFALSVCWKPIKFVRIVDKAVPPPVDYKKALESIHKGRTKHPHYFRYLTFKERQFLEGKDLEEYNKLIEPLEYKHCLQDGLLGDQPDPDDQIVSIFDEVNIMAFNAKMVASPLQILAAIYETYCFAETHIDIPDAPELNSKVWTDKIISEIPMANHVCSSSTYNVQKELFRRLNLGYRYRVNPEPFMPLANQPALLCAIGPTGRTHQYFLKWSRSQDLIPLSYMQRCISSKAVRRHYRINRYDPILLEEGLECALFHRMIALSQPRDAPHWRDIVPLQDPSVLEDALVPQDALTSQDASVSRDESVSRDMVS